MSRTYSHGKNIHKKYKELTKSRACGYEYWSRRPYSNRCGCIPSRFVKRRTIRSERRFNKQLTRIIL